MLFVSPALVAILIALYALRDRMHREAGFGLRMLVIGMLIGWKSALILLR